MQVREYCRGDEKKILNLFQLSFDKPLAREYWAWRYRDNPFGEGIIRLLFDGQELIGHYAVIPMQVEFDNRTVKAAFSMTTMTHPEYRGKGIFVSLAEETYRACGDSGIELVFGFPNVNSYYGFTEKLGWHGFGNMAGWEIHIGEVKYVAEKGIIVGKEAYFADEFDKFWQTAKPEGKVAVPRGEKYLNWRYIENPEETYEVFSFRSKNNELLGYTVLKEYWGGEEPVGHIVDMLFCSDASILSIGVKHAMCYFNDRGTRKLSCWTTDSREVSALEAIGFAKVEWPVYFGVKKMNNSEEYDPDIMEFGKWRLTMGDSDVF